MRQKIEENRRKNQFEHHIFIPSGFVIHVPVPAVFQVPSGFSPIQTVFNGSMGLTVSKLRPNRTGPRFTAESVESADPVLKTLDKI